MYETSRQSRFNARYWMLGAGALGRPRGMVWGGTWEEGSGWGTHVYLWRIHVDIWQNQYNIVKLKIKLKKLNIKKKSAYNAGDLDSIPGSEISLGEGNGNPFQYSWLEYPMDISLEGYSPRDCKESNTTDQLTCSCLHSFT